MDTTAIFNGFNAKKVLIVGDAMIDAYMWGNINRMSPEAPVPVVEVHTHENRLGGAANVALNLKALGATPILCAVIGDDNKGALFQQLMAKQQLSTDGILIDKKRKTTTKTRVIAQQKHQLRVDEEDIFPITVEDDFLKLIHALITDVDVIVLQDYNKGVLTPKVIEEVIKMANKSNIPTIVDPKKQNFTSYKNCTIFKPNLAEIKAGIEISFSADNIEELQQATSHLRTLLNAEGVLLTINKKGSKKLYSLELEKDGTFLSFKTYNTPHQSITLMDGKNTQEGFLFVGNHWKEKRVGMLLNADKLTYNDNEFKIINSNFLLQKSKLGEFRKLNKNETIEPVNLKELKY